MRRRISGLRAGRKLEHESARPDSAAAVECFEIPRAANRIFSAAFLLLLGVDSHSLRCRVRGEQIGSPPQVTIHEERGQIITDLVVPTANATKLHRNVLDRVKLGYVEATEADAREPRIY